VKPLLVLVRLSSLLARLSSLLARLSSLLARLSLLLVAIGGCDASVELSLAIRMPADPTKLLTSVQKLNLRGTRDGVVLAQQSYSSTADYVSLDGVTHGPRTEITLEGVDSSGDVIARGRTCPIDFEGGGVTAPLYFAPTNFFAETANQPLATRTQPIALALSSGQVLIFGGASTTASELFTPGYRTFRAGSDGPTRFGAQAVSLSSIGVLAIGGVDDQQVPLADGVLYLESTQQFVSITGLAARVEPRVVVTSDGLAFVSGGYSLAADGSKVPLASTEFVYVLSDGTYQVSAGTSLAEARYAHAATVAIGVPMVFGGMGASGVLDSIEAVSGDTTTPPIAALTHARAGATASVLSDGEILLVGGVGSDSQPLASAELFNPITRTTTVYSMAAARSGHTATVMEDGRVLVAGGRDAGGNALSSVELFATGVGFVTERSMTTARADHRAVPLCDGTVLLIGGAASAELYSQPAS
jgi:hypothetical protein